MRSIILKKLLLFGFFTAFLFICISSPVLAQNDPDNAIKYEFYYPPTLTPTPIQLPTPTSTPPVTPTVSAPTPISQNPTSAPTNNFIYFSQHDPEWADYNKPPLETISQCGCVETSIAMVLATLLDKTGNPREGPFNPRKIWDEIESISPIFCGSSFKQYISLLRKNNFAQTTIVAYNPASPDKNNQMLSNYLTNGWYIILGLKFGLQEPGHAVVLSHIENNIIYIYDPASLPGTKQPVALRNDATIEMYLIIK